MSVKRYSVNLSVNERVEVTESLHGSLVKYHDYAALEARCAALAAEVQAVKALARGWANATDDRLFEEHGEIFHDSIEACEEELKTICPTTDAFLAEIRASAIKDALKSLDGVFDNDCVMESNGISYEDAEHRTAGAYAVSKALEEFADQVRKGVQS